MAGGVPSPACAWAWGRVRAEAEPCGTSSSSPVSLRTLFPCPRLKPLNKDLNAPVLLQGNSVKEAQEKVVGEGIGELADCRQLWGPQLVCLRPYSFLCLWSLSPQLGSLGGFEAS